MVAKPLCPLYKNIIKPLDRARYPELRYIFNKSLSRIPLKSYALLGLLGMFLFSFDYIRLNGIASGKGNSNISLLGSFSSLFMPILLVLG
ncbi:membrane protein, partial [human gut metagenome]